MLAQATALIAEDEPLLAESLRIELMQLWPELSVLGTVSNGHSAVMQALRLRPQIVFLDIRMPGLNGLEAAQVLTEDWPDDGGPCPLIVFVTAYDQHALDAFEQAAVDYVLKPVQPQRLQRTCQRLQQALARQRSQAPEEESLLVARLRQLLEAEQSSSARSGQAAACSANEEALPILTMLQASQGSTLHMIPIEDVIYFEAADKYVRVITAQSEHLLRMSLRELTPRLPPGQFWQIHRGTLVRANAIATARREENGRYTLTLKGHDDKLSVSRLHTHLFKAM